MVDNVNVLVHKLKQLLYVASNNYRIDLPVHNFGKKLEQMKNGTWGYLTDLQSVVTIKPPKETSNNPIDWEISVKEEFVQQQTEEVDKQLANSVHILIPKEVNGTIQWGFSKNTERGTEFSEMISVEDTKYEGKCVMVQREIPPGTAIPFLGRLPVTNDTERIIHNYDNEDYDMTASVRIPDMGYLKMDHIEWTQPLKGINSALNARIYCSPESEEKWALPNSFIGARCNEPSADPFTIITHILEQLPYDETNHSTPLFNENKSENSFDKLRCQQYLKFHVDWLNTMEEYHYRRLLKDNLFTKGWLKILPFLFRSTNETTDDSGTYKPVGLSRRSFLIAMFVGRERQHRVLYVLNLLLLAHEEIIISEIIDENTLISWQSHSVQHLLANNRQRGLYCQIIKYVKMGVVFNRQALLPEKDHVPRVTSNGASYSGWPKWDGAHLKEDKDLRRSVQLQNDSYPADILRSFNWSQESGVPRNKWVVLEQVSSDGYYKIGYLSVWVVSFKTSPNNVMETHAIRDKLRRAIRGETRLSRNECRKLKLNYPQRRPQHLHCTDVFIKELGLVRVPADQTKLLIGKYLMATKVETRKIGIVRFVPKEGSASNSHGGKKRKRIRSTMYDKTAFVCYNLESNLPPYENKLDGSLLDGFDTRIATSSTSPVTPYYILYGNGKAFSELYVPNASVVSTTKWLREKDIRTGTQDYSHCFKDIQKDSKSKDSKNMLPLVYVITLKRLYPGDTVTFCYNHGGAHHRKMHNLKMKMKNSTISESERGAFYTTITESLHSKKVLEFRKQSHLDAFNAHYRPTYIPSTVCMLGSENLCETSEELYDRMWK